MADFRYRWIPVASLDVRRMEAWLEDMSEKGLILAAVAAGIGIFRETEPRRRKCRIVAAELFPVKEREAKLHLYERLGWECVVGWGNRFLVFLASEETPEEIAEDETAAFRRLRRRTGIFFSAGLLLAAVFLGTWFGRLTERNGFYAGLLGGDLAGFLVMGLLALAGVCWLGGRFFRACCLCAASGPSDVPGDLSSPEIRKRNWRREKHRRLVIWFLWLGLLAGSLAALRLQRGSLRSGNYTEEMVLPVLPLATVAGEDGWDYTGRVSEDGWQIDNSYTAFWRLLAPENYRTVQNGRREDGGAEILRAECRKTVFRWLARGYYEEKLAAYRNEYGESKGLDEAGMLWEAGAFFEGSDEQILLLQAGAWVVVYRYEGASDLSQFAAEAAIRLK